VVERSFRRIT